MMNRRLADRSARAWPSSTRYLGRLFLALALFAALGPGCSSKENAADGGPRFEGLDPAAAAELIQERRGEDRFVILDVRTPEEFREDRIEGAVNIDFRSRDFREQLATLDRDATYLLYCRSGNRSGQSLPLFRELGFRDVRHLSHGILAWKGAGRPTVQG